MEFLGRAAELSFLESAWAAERSAFIPVYGRRRVGKSELIVRFMDRKPGVYFTGNRAPAATQIEEFLEAAGRTLQDPALAAVRGVSWRKAIELVLHRVPQRGKFILALDEFQWMAQASPELPSLLQELWDRSWSKSGQIFLILCGSYLGFMEKEVLGSKSPLFGRRTGQILLRPFNHLEAARFHPNLSVTDQARIYALCGGIPAYLLEFDGRLSVEQNIVRHILAETSFLAREPEFLLREELREVAPYHAILLGLAEGFGSPTQLGRLTGMDVRALPHYLQSLIGLGHVQRRVPLTDPPPGPRIARYALDDPFLRFWFRFVFRSQSTLRFLGPEKAFAEVVRPGLDAYFGLCFERLCREALPMIYAAEGVAASFAVGEYWDRKLQIDVVGLRRDHWIDLGECKWRGAVSAGPLAAELEEKVKKYPNSTNATLGRRLFVHSIKSKATPPAGIRIHTLEDLYRLPLPGG